MSQEPYRSVSPVELILVRHGTTADNLASRWSGWQDTPLSQSGRRQAEAVASYLAEIASAEILYCSPLSRALTTAALIGERLGLAPRIHSGLKEAYFGAVEGMLDIEVQRLHPDMYAAAQDLGNLDFRWPGGESRRDFVTRIRRTLGAIIAAEDGAARKLVVGHGGMFSLFLADLMEGDPSRWPKYMMNNCSVTKLELSSAGPKLVLLNYCDHLDGAGPDLARDAWSAPPLWKISGE